MVPFHSQIGFGQGWKESCVIVMSSDQSYGPLQFVWRAGSVYLPHYIQPIPLTSVLARHESMRFSTPYSHISPILVSKNATWRWHRAHPQISMCDKYIDRQMDHLVKALPCNGLANKKINKHLPILHFYHRQTDRQTDRQTEGDA